MVPRKHFIVILSLLAHVAIAQGQSTSNSKAPMPGHLYDAGGHTLHLNIQGKGSPAVIFENGSGDFSFIWTLVQPDIATFTKTVSYDRAGYAWSQPGPTPRTSKQIGFELHSALKNAGIHPPYILVGQSFGGFIVRAFARFYPTEVVGIVLVEAVQENQKIFMGGDKPQLIRDFAKGKTAPAIQTHFTPAPDTSTSSVPTNNEMDPLYNKMPSSIQQYQLWAQSQPAFMRSVQAEMEWSPEDVANIYNHRGEKDFMLGDMPLIVLTRGKGGFDGRADSLQLEKERLAAQDELAKLSSNSEHILDINSGHNIHVEDPAMVIAAIKKVYAAVTKKRLLKDVR